ncbi:MAG: tetratricopeptide repeat protein [Pseudomonadota bacterium]
MDIKTYLRQCVVTVITCVVWFSLPAAAQEARLGDLMAQLREAEPAAATRLTREIELEWSRSGSASLNMLLERGREALEREEYRTAVGHLTALTDHAPDFAEGWHSRARAYFALDLYGPAIEDLGQALRLNPDHFQALFGLGVMFQELGDTRRAAEAFQRALDLHPNFEEAQEALKRLERTGIGRTL